MGIESVWIDSRIRAESDLYAGIKGLLDVPAQLVLYAFDAFGCAFSFGVIFVRQKIVIAVAAGNAERRTAGIHARPRYHAFADGVAQSNICITAGPHIADRSEARLQ